MLYNSKEILMHSKLKKVLKSVKIAFLIKNIRTMNHLGN